MTLGSSSWAETQPLIAPEENIYELSSQSASRLSGWGVRGVAGVAAGGGCWLASVVPSTALPWLPDARGSAWTHHLTNPTTAFRPPYTLPTFSLPPCGRSRRCRLFPRPVQLAFTSSPPPSPPPSLQTPRSDGRLSARAPPTHTQPFPPSSLHLGR
ncbi:hypothetical protein O3P69_005424 [Scylla paramamosain]|uniref:Uncharacterized protein n=1 Tax=Scylla paramamosain TaxID=85552 RepID=A0AAW0U9V4_SCYPA